MVVPNIWIALRYVTEIAAPMVVTECTEGAVAAVKNHIRLYQAKSSNSGDEQLDLDVETIESGGIFEIQASLGSEADVALLYKDANTALMLLKTAAKARNREKRIHIEAAAQKFLEAANTFKSLKNSRWIASELFTFAGVCCLSLEQPQPELACECFAEARKYADMSIAAKDGKIPSIGRIPLPFFSRRIREDVSDQQLLVEFLDIVTTEVQPQLEGFENRGIWKKWF